MSNVFTCPDSNKQFNLPRNLYLHQRKVAGKWRYKGPHGLKAINYYIDDLPNYIDTQTAVRAAKALNEKYSQKEPETYVIQQGSMPYWVEQFISDTEYVDRKGKLDSSANWTGLKYLLRDFGRTFRRIPLNKITMPMLSDWWFTKGDFADQKLITYHSQKKRKGIMGKLFAYLLQKDLVSLKGNPFKDGSDFEFSFTPVEDKVRSRLTLDQFMTIRESALMAGDIYLVNGMDLGLQTKLRRADLCSLKFDDWNKKELITGIGKSINQKGKDLGQYNKWDLTDKANAPILDILKRCTETRSSVLRNNCNTIAEHVLHHKWNDTRLGKHKTHYSQVLPTKLSRTFQEHRDTLSVFRAMPAAERPSFHEIRGLAGHLEEKMGRDLEEIAKGYAHSDTKVTLNKYLNNHEKQIVQVTTAIPLNVIKSELSRPSTLN